MRKAFINKDAILEEAVNTLIQLYKCHTVVLYGSRARREESPKSDYDLMGVRRSGKKFRYAEKRNGFYIDAFIFSEKDLHRIDESHLYMKDSRVLYQMTNYGEKLVKKIKTAVKKPYKPLPEDELQVRKIWAYKMLERIKVDDIEAKYRRSWLHESLLYDYFNLRKKRYSGSKQSFDWLKLNDRKTYNLFSKVLDRPNDLKLLKLLVDRVTQS
jgi:predicted nucleotidyltransferase